MDPAETKDFYYKRCFPVEAIWNFFTAHTRSHPDRREFAITFDVGGGDEAWARYKSAETSQELRKLTCSRNFHTLHTGPIFSDRASLKARIPLDIVGQFLVFDLDLEEALFQYDARNQLEVDRFCKMAFAKAAVLIAILTECFGFQSFMPVYSGRRGVHLYVLDATSPSGNEVWKYANDVRKAICATVDVRNKHDPRVVHSESIVNNPNFDREAIVSEIEKAQRLLLTPKYNGGVGLLDDKADVVRFLNLLFDDSGHEGYRKRFRAEVEAEAMLNFKSSQSLEMLVIIKHSCASIHKREFERKHGHRPTANNAVNTFYTNRIDDIMLAMAWPELDAAVTGNTVHCVKAPFSLHGKTGRVALPVRAERLKDCTALPPIVTAEDVMAGSCGDFDAAVAMVTSFSQTLAKRQSQSQSAGSLDW
jgi:DNA primase small subunit